MYFPYLLVRGEEKEAILSTVCIFEDQKVIPILEPFSEDEDDLYSYKSLIKVVEGLVKSKKKFILLIEDESNLNKLKAEFPNLDQYCIHGYESKNSNYLNARENIQVAIIHRNQNYNVIDSDQIIYHVFVTNVLRFSSYINKYNSSKRVYVEDGFIKYERNSFYPVVDDFNSELCFTYKGKNIAGFGDFTILEEGFIPVDGARQNDITHVIHLTQKPDNENKLVVHHFLTTPAMEIDNRRRSIDTVKKAYDNRHKFLRTIGIQWIEDKYPNSTSLGMYKRIGIAHHIELISKLI